MNNWTTRAAALAGGEPVFWQRLAWPEVRGRVAAGADLALLPLGATEQHGPHLPLDVDSVLAESFCAYASAKTGAAVLPVVTYGCSLGHTAHWPGTLSLMPETLIATLREIARFVAAAGVRRLMLVNSHWGNVPSARCAIDHVRFSAFETADDFKIGLRSTFDLTPSIWQQFTDDAADFHANRAETALILALDPASVRLDRVADSDDPDRTAGRVFTHVVPLTSANGVTGHPSSATAADGEKLFLEIGDALVAVVRQAMTETPPTSAGGKPMKSNEAPSPAVLKSKLIKAGVQYLLAAFVDVFGVPKAKCVPIAKFDELVAGGELYTVGAVEGMGLVGPQEDECQTVPDLSRTVICPWDKRFAWLPSDCHYHGEPYGGDARVLLQKVLSQANEMGFTFDLGIEPEFYVLRKDETGKLVPLAPSPFKGPNACYDVNQTFGSMAFLDPMCRYLDELGWGVHSFDQECGRGQFEFDFHYADALTMADRFVFLRQMAKQVAGSIGAIATFMPKPFANDFRSGAHFNMSLANAEGKNVFLGDGSEPLAKKHGLKCSDLCLHFVAGLLAHAPALTAVCCPSFNSYKGLIAQGDLPEMSWAPVLRCYGKNNRSAMLRLPMSRPCVENRAVDMSVNAHLAAALSLAAGLDGIRQKLDPGEPLNDNLYSLSAGDVEKRSVSRLPQTLLEAIRAFEADELVTETFGRFQAIYVEQKQKEWSRNFYRVTDEERAEALQYV